MFSRFLGIFILLCSSLRADFACRTTFGRVTVADEWVEVKTSELNSQRQTSSSQDVKAVFNRYWDSRLSVFSDAEKKEISKHLPKVTFNPGGKSEVSAGGINLPKEFKDTVIQYLTQAHENEHTLQFMEKGIFKEMNRRLVFLLEWLYHPRKSYEMELGAMRAEWEFLSLVPDSIKTKAVERAGEFIEDVNLKGAVIGMLSAKASTVEEYLRIQHSLGRYSYNERMKYAIKNQTITASATILAILGALRFAASFGPCVGSDCP